MVVPFVHPNFVLDQKVDLFFKNNYKTLSSQMTKKVQQKKPALNAIEVQNRMQLEMFVLKENFSLQLKRKIAQKIEERRQNAKLEGLSDSEVKEDVILYKMCIMENAIDIGERWLAKQKFSKDCADGDDEEKEN